MARHLKKRRSGINKAWLYIILSSLVAFIAGYYLSINNLLF